MTYKWFRRRGRGSRRILKLNPDVGSSLHLTIRTQIFLPMSHSSPACRQNMIMNIYVDSKVVVVPKECIQMHASCVYRYTYVYT